MSGVLEWKVTDSLEKTGPADGEGGVAIYVRDRLECMELCLGSGDQLAESLWVRVKGKTAIGDITVGIC